MGEIQTQELKDKIRQVFYEELPEVIQKHPEVREFLKKLLKSCDYKNIAESRFEILLEELKELKKDSDKRWRENQEEIKELKRESEERWRKYQEELKELKKESEERWRKGQEEIKRLREESQKRWEKLQKESDERWKFLVNEIKKLHRKHDVSIGALGARWGIKTEVAFREAIKGILEESFPVKVIRYVVKDDEGKVFGQPDIVELDLIIKNGQTIAGEIKSSVSKADVYIFEKKTRFYEEKEGKKINRKIIISPMVDKGAK